MSRPIDRFLKRSMDITGALVGITLFSPIMLATAIGVRITMGSPVIFRQIRPGKDQKPFGIYKFRSMKSGQNDHGVVLSDADRLTKFGTFIRNYSLDELPQFFNILKGDISFVGPRPLLFDYFPYYTETEMRRHEVNQGVTGWAQVHGRNNLNWDDRLKMDVWYVDNWTIWLDIKILLMTIKTVLTREGVTQEGHATFFRLDDARKAEQAAKAN